MTNGTIARTIILIIALANQILVVLGYNPLPFEDETVTELISLIFTVIASGWAWWKNNSITKAAREADQFLARLKQAK